MKKILGWMVLIIFLILVEYYLGWERVFAPWQEIPFKYVVTGISLLVLSYGIRTLRLYDYFAPSTTWWLSVRLVLLHNFLNNILPARTGELSFPLLVKRYFSISYKQSVPALLWFRFLDLHMILSLALLIWVIDRQEHYWYVLFLVWLVLPWCVFYLRGAVTRMLKCILSSQKFTKIDEYLSGLPESHVQFYKSWLLTLLNWIVKVGIIAWFMGLFIGAEFSLLIYAAVVGELTSVLPVHAPGGFGTYEAGILSVLVSSVEAESAGIAAINTHLLLLSGSLVSALCAWFIPVKKGE